MNAITTGLVSLTLALGAALVGCAADVEPESESVVDSREQALASRPACTAANEGQTITEPVRGGTQTLRCESGTWQLVRKCTNGRCIDY